MVVTMMPFVLGLLHITVVMHVLVLERLRESMAQGLDAPSALEAVAAQCAFTTHTPVAAGHDAQVEAGWLRLPDRPGIGFEAQDALYAIMKAMG